MNFLHELEIVPCRRTEGCSWQDPGCKLSPKKLSHHAEDTSGWVNWSRLLSGKFLIKSVLDPPSFLLSRPRRLRDRRSEVRLGQKRIYMHACRQWQINQEKTNQGETTKPQPKRFMRVLCKSFQGNPSTLKPLRKRVVFFWKLAGFVVADSLKSSKSSDRKQLSKHQSIAIMITGSCPPWKKKLSPNWLAVGNLWICIWQNMERYTSHFTIANLQTLIPPGMRITKNLKVILRCKGFCTFLLLKSTWNPGQIQLSIDIPTYIRVICESNVDETHLLHVWNICLRLT